MSDCFEKKKRLELTKIVQVIGSVKDLLGHRLHMSRRRLFARSHRQRGAVNLQILGEHRLLVRLLAMQIEHFGLIAGDSPLTRVVDQLPLYVVQAAVCGVAVVLDILLVLEADEQVEGGLHVGRGAARNVAVVGEQAVGRLLLVAGETEGCFAGRFGRQGSGVHVLRGADDVGVVRRVH